jgi:hypothetical protein
MSTVTNGTDFRVPLVNVDTTQGDDGGKLEKILNVVLLGAPRPAPPSYEFP